MSDQGEKTCPLCAEEMDFTDQQLKPCKCGYEICVWCWHHLMDMAEKDDTEGKCPACRTPYNKEKIVDKARKCERLMAEVNMERKVKSQKSKSKTSEGRKQLTSVRVIQRNLVYIVGLPLDLADEDLLQQKDYFGQYGKVLKVSISRTAAGTIQHFANNTCSVYITYSKEEDAVCCIQSIHGFILDGRSLRACFGTTKYCHAWLRSMPCTNPDCLYLHEIGSQEDSYTKDEIISAYTSRAQQITSSAVDMQRRSGSMLPPPADENYNSAPAYMEKPVSQSPTHNPPSTLRISPPNSSSGKSAALPAAASWGTRAANSHPPTSLPSPNVQPKQRPESSSGLLSFSMAVATPAQDSTSLTDTEKKVNGEIRKSQPKEKSDTMQPLKQYLGTHSFSTTANRTALQKDKDKITIPPQKLDVTVEEKVEKISADLASVSVSGLKADELRSNGPDQFKDIRSNAIEDDLLSSDNRLKDPILTTNTNYQNPNGSSLYSNGYTENAHMFIKEEKRNATADMGESSIISNILSMNFDSWEEPLTLPQNFANLLGESDKQQGSFGVSSSWKVQNSNQSRFSFAREDERMVNNSSNYDSNLNMEGGIQNSRYFNNGFVNNGDTYQDKFSNYNGFSSVGVDEPDHFLGSHSQFYSNKQHSGSRSQISAPPGFSAPNRAPPPGFASQERVDQPFDAISANHFLDASTFRKQYQQPQPPQQQPSVHFDTTGDLEFIDPAILAVGKGRFPGGPHSPSLDTRSSLNFTPQLSNNFETEARLQLMMQRSLNHRYTENNDFFSHNNNNFDSSSSYGLPSSRMMAAQNNLSQYSQFYLPNPRNGAMTNGSWDEWNEIQNGNKYYNRYEEDSKYRMTGSADLYNRTYGI